ncbi:hypothetical protein ACIQXD_29520 [Streptomyces uncialis]|uniref:hypothetical protein n=1 Tax=Streptomyces uncialis TaxID=1048205 RepID=UPI0038171B5E
MSFLTSLLIGAAAFAIGFGALLVEQAIWDRRDQRLFCMTCGTYHPKQKPC